MTAWRYCSTDLLTGEVLADSIPALSVQSFSQQLNGGGALSGSLNLSQDYASNAAALEALTPRRSVLWCLANQGSGWYPAWNGVVWDRPDTSRTSGTIPVQASTMDSVWSYRLVLATLEYQDLDMFTVFADLLSYGTTLESAYITPASPVQGPPSPLIAQGCRVAGLRLPPAGLLSGQSWSASYLYSDLGEISDNWSDMVSAGLEYAFVPGMDGSGNLFTSVQLGYNPGLGRAYPLSGYAVTYPGNASDYGYAQTGSQSANFVIATAPPNGSAEQWESAYPHGADTADIQAGFPVMMTTESWDGSTVTSQGQINRFADGQVTLQTQGMTQPVITIPDGALPGVLDVVLGDQFGFAATSPLHPAGPGGTPGLQSTVRLTGWTVIPSAGQQPGSLQLTTSQILATV